MRQFAISDIHGCLKTFQALLEKISFNKTDELFLLGDYIDRGPDSKGVIDHIWKLQEEKYKVTCLRGNHEQMVLDAFGNNHGKKRMWKRNGGKQCLKSFGVSNANDLPEEYLDFMEALPFYMESGRYILVHAGLDFTKRDPFENQYDMLWIRRWYSEMDKDWMGSRMVIHGHTAVIKGGLELQLERSGQYNAMNVDAGCVYAGKKEGLGNLCALDLTNWTLHFQPNIDSPSAIYSPYP